MVYGRSYVLSSILSNMTQNFYISPVVTKSDSVHETAKIQK